jgi:hypothetical protein
MRKRHETSKVGGLLAALFVSIPLPVLAQHHGGGGHSGGFSGGGGGFGFGSLGGAPARQQSMMQQPTVQRQPTMYQQPVMQQPMMQRQPTVVQQQPVRQPVYQQPAASQPQRMPQQHSLAQTVQVQNGAARAYSLPANNPLTNQTTGQVTTNRVPPSVPPATRQPGRLTPNRLPTNNPLPRLGGGRAVPNRLPATNALPGQAGGHVAANRVPATGPLATRRPNNLIPNRLPTNVPRPIPRGTGELGRLNSNLATAQPIRRDVLKPTPNRSVPIRTPVPGLSNRLGRAGIPPVNRPTLGAVATDRRPGTVRLRSRDVTPASNRVAMTAVNPGKGKGKGQGFFLGGQNPAGSANSILENLGNGLTRPTGLGPAASNDFNTLKQDIARGAGNATIRQDIQNFHNAVAAQGNANQVHGLPALDKQLDTVTALANLRRQLGQGPLGLNLPLPIGLATLINDPTLPTGQLICLGPNIVVFGGPLAGGGVVGVPAGGVVGVPGDAGVAVDGGLGAPAFAGIVAPPDALTAPGPDGQVLTTWTGALADLGVPVQEGAPVSDVDPPTTGDVQVNQVVLLNPESNGGPVQYTLGDGVGALDPGYEEAHDMASPQTISFDRGGDFGTAQYTLADGAYQFVVTDRGWDLRRKTFEVTLDNSDNPNDFSYNLGDEVGVVPARQSRTIRKPSVVRVAFDRGGDADPAVKELGDGSYKVGVDARTGLLDLFSAAEPAADQPPPPPDAPAPGPTDDAAPARSPARPS